MSVSSVSPSVHPHARGDNYCANWPPCAAYGSPPRAWGQRDAVHYFIREFRFTPTRVGTTIASLYTATSGPVHPHARGDNTSFHPPPHPSFGSPPRAWGQPATSVEHKPFFRFTPTRVGTTVTTKPALPYQPVHPHARGDNTCQVIDSAACGRGKGPRSHRSGVPFGPKFGFESLVRYHSSK